MSSNLNLPNPFTIRPIPTNVTGNELLLTDPIMRQRAFVSIIDNSLLDSSKNLAPMHVDPGWRWK